jgi:outer membrane protein OmpA-like peptidoglycan-associated protein
VPISIPTTSLKGAKVTNAFLQLFIDDFQAPSLCSKFSVTLNGKRFVEAERLLDAIDQTGPVGKLISLPIPEEFWPDLTGAKPLVVLVDETKGAADGFALDFVRVLVNRKRESTCKGNFVGRVVEKDSDRPIAKARVTLADKTTVETDADGRFSFKDVPTGFEVVTASASGYADGSSTADVGTGDDNPEVTIALKKAAALVFGGKKLAVGEALSLNTILFDAGKADLKPESKPELEKVAQFMKANPNAEVELSGHTSSEGEAQMNRSLSYRRVKACKDYVVGKGVDAGRIIAVGFGPDRPVAPNSTEAGRKQNRRVELRVVKN